jgi:tripartite-type tricarboxylate transporter receptor subunit TctC
MIRRNLLLLSLCCLALAGMHAGAQEKYPSKPVKILVPYAPGGATDIITRLVSEQLRQSLGQQFVVESKPGAFGIPAIEEMARSRPDGHTLMVGNVSTNAITPVLFEKKMSINYEREVASVGRLATLPSFLIVTTKNFAPKTVAELVAYAKANPGKLNYGSSGVGTSLHLGMELFMQKSGTKMVHVPFRGSAPMLTALLGGQVDLAMDAASTSLQHVQSGKLRALAVTTPERAFFAPDLPPLKDTLPDVEITAWHGIMAPGGTPRSIIEKLSTEIQAFLRSPAAEVKLRQQGVIRVGNSPDEFARIVAEEVARFRPIVEQAGVQVGQ